MAITANKYPKVRTGGCFEPIWDTIVRDSHADPVPRDQNARSTSPRETIQLPGSQNPDNRQVDHSGFPQSLDSSPSAANTVTNFDLI